MKVDMLKTAQVVEVYVLESFYYLQTFRLWIRPKRRLMKEMKKVLMNRYFRQQIVEMKSTVVAVVARSLMKSDPRCYFWQMAAKYFLRNAPG
jgi:hypothetical protein